MLRLNVTDMSDLELTEHIKALTEEQEMRKFNHKAKAWESFRYELMDYLKKYGPIEICDGHDIYNSLMICSDHTLDTSESGKIILS